MQKNHLFFIGINKYEAISSLSCCVKDCVDLKNVLLGKFDFINDNVVELYNDMATLKKISDVLINYAQKLNANDNIVIYYSGHGFYSDQTKAGYWMPYDCRNGRYDTYLSNSHIIKLLNKIKARHIFLMSDSCFSRSILLAKGYTQELVDEKAKDQNDDIDKNYDEYESRWALSAGANEIYDGPIGDNSPFAKAVINILKNTNIDLRVGTLIEEVKKKFDLESVQKPQGYPFKDARHRGGEFIFKIVSDTISYKDYCGFYDLLKHYNKNMRYERIADISIKSDKVGYQVYRSYDSVMETPIYYMMLSRGVNQNKTYDHIMDNHSEILKDNKLIILIPREAKLIIPERRIENIKEKFKPTNVFFIEDFIRDHCTPVDLRTQNNEKYLRISNFILPTYRVCFYNESEKSAEVQGDCTQLLKEWVEKRDEMIIVLIGAGGIGKTTFAKYMADRYLNNNEKSFCVFIKCNDIIDELNKRVAKKNNIDLYDFYEIDHDYNDISSTAKLSNELFTMNFDAGNLLLVIDGLDEVVSKVQNFIIDEFLESIYNYNKDFNKGKVIFTIRSYFWDKKEGELEKIIVLDLLPFNNDQMLSFFGKSFNSNERAIEKAKEIADDFKYPNEDKEFIYHPYLLDVIRSMVTVGLDEYKNDPSFCSDILQKQVKNDYIIFKICKREIIRIGQINVDEQLRFFIDMSIKKRGVVRLIDFDCELSRIVGKRIDKKTIEAFKSHPFLEINDKSLVFKYDFFDDYFKCIYVSEFLRFNSEKNIITEEFVDILMENCWYGSGINKDVRNRVIRWTEDDVLKCSDLVGQIIESDYSDNQKRLSLSGLFNLVLSINIRYRANNIAENTSIMKMLFSKNANHLDSLCLINIYDKKDVIRFDFSDIRVDKSFIDNYKSFWMCHYNKNTLFRNSFILNNKTLITNRLSIKKDQFVDCTTDDDFEAMFIDDDRKRISYEAEIELFLQKYFKLFYKKGRLIGQTVNKSAFGRSAYNCLRISYNKQIQNFLSFGDAMDFFKRMEIIDYYDEYNEAKADIKKIYKDDIIKYIEDGTVSSIIMRIYKELGSLPNVVEKR